MESRVIYCTVLVVNCNVGPFQLVILIPIEFTVSKYCIDDWRADGYRWFQYGTKLIPRSKPAFKKIYFTSVLPSGHDKRFKRLAFFRIGEMASQASVLIHYLGDETIAVDFSHGNCNHRVFHRSHAVLADLSSIQDLPSNAYKSAIAKPPTECSAVQQSVYMPRNLRQIKNLQSKERQKSRLTRDALYNLHEIAYDLDGFVKIIHTYPDLIVICGLDELFHELSLILSST